MTKYRVSIQENVSIPGLDGMSLTVGSPSTDSRSRSGVWSGGSLTTFDGSDASGGEGEVVSPIPSIPRDQPDSRVSFWMFFRDPEKELAYQNEYYRKMYTRGLLIDFLFMIPFLLVFSILWKHSLIWTSLMYVILIVFGVVKICLVLLFVLKRILKFRFHLCSYFVMELFYYFPLYFVIVITEMSDPFEKLMYLELQFPDLSKTTFVIASFFLFGVVQPLFAAALVHYFLLMGLYSASRFVFFSPSAYFGLMMTLSILRSGAFASVFLIYNRVVEGYDRRRFDLELIQKAKREVMQEKERITNGLLENVFPVVILQHISYDIVLGSVRFFREYRSAFCLSADVVNFTLKLKQFKLQLINALNDIFCLFDNLLETYKTLFKLKTIGDQILVMGVIERNAPQQSEVHHAFEICSFALSMIRSIDEFNKDVFMKFDIAFRIGIAFSSPCSLGIIGKKNFTIDVLGGSCFSDSLSLEGMSAGNSVLVDGKTRCFGERSFVFRKNTSTGKGNFVLESQSKGEVVRAVPGFSPEVGGSDSLEVNPPNRGKAKGKLHSCSRLWVGKLRLFFFYPFSCIWKGSDFVKLAVLESRETSEIFVSYIVNFAFLLGYISFVVRNWYGVGVLIWFLFSILLFLVLSVFFTLFSVVILKFIKHRGFGHVIIVARMVIQTCMNVMCILFASMLLYFSKAFEDNYMYQTLIPWTMMIFCFQANCVVFTSILRILLFSLVVIHGSLVHVIQTSQTVWDVILEMNIAMACILLGHIVFTYKETIQVAFIRKIQVLRDGTKNLRDKKETNTTLILSILPRVILRSYLNNNLGRNGVRVDRKAFQKYQRRGTVSFLQINVENHDRLGVSFLRSVFEKWDRILEAQTKVLKIKNFSGNFLMCSAFSEDQGPVERMMNVVKVATKMKSVALKSMKSGKGVYSFSCGVECGEVYSNLFGSTRWIFDIISSTVNLSARICHNTLIPKNKIVLGPVAGKMLDSSRSIGFFEVKGLGEKEFFLLPEDFYSDDIFSYTNKE